MGIWKERNCWLDWMLLPMAYELWKMSGLTSSKENKVGSPEDVDQLMLAEALLCQSVGVSKTNAAAKGARATRALITRKKSVEAHTRRDDDDKTYLTAANILDEGRKSTFGEVEGDGARARSKGNVANVARGIGLGCPRFYGRAAGGASRLAEASSSRQPPSESGNLPGFCQPNCLEAMRSFRSLGAGNAPRHAQLSLDCDVRASYAYRVLSRYPSNVLHRRGRQCGTQVAGRDHTEFRNSPGNSVSPRGVRFYAQFPFDATPEDTRSTHLARRMCNSHHPHV